MIKRKFLKIILLSTLIFALGAGFGHFYSGKINFPQVELAEEKNTKKAFLSESYDKIKENYWELLSDEQLINMFKDASSALGNPVQGTVQNKHELIQKIDKEKATKIVTNVLTNLKPLGRSSLYTEKQEVALKNLVENRNPETGEVEPTISTRVIGTSIYLKFIKFSPTSLNEFQETMASFESNKNLDSFIFDLRGNIGGAIDATAYFLGFFLGKNQLAFEFYQKGDFLPFRTPTDKISSISKYKQIVVLIDNQTQSSAEMMAASFKKYNLAIVLGQTSKGWGTVEKVFQLDNQFDQNEKYSMFLVHSITLRDDNEPIEGRGVDPDIKLSDPDWEAQLYSYFKNPQLNRALKDVI